MRNIWGIDPDTKRITIVYGPKNDFTHIKIPLDDGEGHTKSCGLAFRGLCEHMGEFKEEFGQLPLIYLEAPVVGKGGPGPTISQAMISGALQAAAEEYVTQLVLVNNQSWKKRAMGNGNINKDQVAERMKDIWPELWEAAKGHLPLEGTPGGGPFRDQNLIDAGGLYLFGKHNYQLKERIRQRRSQ
jgi:hypothetical protein